MACARSKINAISLNVKINKRKSVCGYKLPINVQNFMQKVRLSSIEIIAESRSGATFLTHPVHYYTRHSSNCFIHLHEADPCAGAAKPIRQGQ